MLHWGGYLLLRSDTLPSHADGAIILQGSLVSETARIEGSIRLLRQGVVDKILLSIPGTGFWGQPLPDVARAYLKKQYGSQTSDRFEFCITGPKVDSTEAEALALLPCIREHGLRSIIVVTSNFHSRRARMIWMRTSSQEQPPIQICIDGVADPSFRASGWWRHREYAKTWFFEFTKLLWSLLFR